MMKLLDRVTSSGLSLTQSLKLKTLIFTETKVQHLVNMD